MDLTRSTRFWFGSPGKYHKNISIYFSKAARTAALMASAAPSLAALSLSNSICLRIWIFFFCAGAPKITVINLNGCIWWFISINRNILVVRVPNIFIYIYSVLGKCAPNVLFNSLSFFCASSSPADCLVLVDLLTHLLLLLRYIAIVPFWHFYSS